MSVQQELVRCQGADALGAKDQLPEQESMWTEIFRYRDNRFALLLIMPSFLALVAVQFYPMVYTVWLILTDEKGGFIGLGNLSKLASDTIFWGALTFSLKLAVVIVAGSLLLGLGLALLLRSDYAERKEIWISIFIVPLMVSEISAGLMWKIMYV